MKINIGIELSDLEIEYLKWFNVQDNPRMEGYNPVQWHLEYLGILMITNLDEKGVEMEGYRPRILATGIGKQILEKL